MRGGGYGGLFFFSSPFLVLSEKLKQGLGSIILGFSVEFELEMDWGSR